MNIKACFSRQSDEWATPQSIFDELDREFDFNLDPCATAENHKTEIYYTVADDGLSKNWGGGAGCFVTRRTAGSRIGCRSVTRNH